MPAVSYHRTDRATHMNDNFEDAAWKVSVEPRLRLRIPVRATTA
jgi:hypothetical protein